MTTIAYKDGIIAYDSRITEGDTILTDNFEKKYEQDGLTFFIAGDLGQDQQFANSFILREPQGIKLAQGFVVDGDKLYICTVLSKRVQVYEWHKANPRAVGTGEPFALTAMKLGNSAVDAVKAAMNFDTNTGGKVRTFKL